MSQSHFAIVFPGQGSQTVGMLADLAAKHPLVQSTFVEASEALGYDLWALCQSGPQEELNLTEITQPLLLTSSVAMWRIWESLSGPLPAYLGGHSLGEYSALVAAGVIDFKETVVLVQQRGRFMQEAVPVGEGAMSAILGLDDDVVVEICQGLTSDAAVVEAVNFNSPGQVVIAGHAAAVALAGDKLKEAGAKRVAALPVSAPFHTSLMKPAGDGLAALMANMTFNTPSIPVVHNVHAQTETDGGAIRELMIKQTSAPVRWTDCIRFMVANGVEKTLECGPGKVLCGMSRKIHKPLSVVALDQPDAIETTLAQLAGQQ